ncbi:MAG: RNA methyltransferase [Acidobacteria bacterium]|nr:MAG: RNA methyltransferase [Acidobacteriota bacterium]
MSQHLAPAIVLVRPQEEGNIGAAARAMANMGLERLILVQPIAKIGRTARAFAVGAQDILDGAEIAPTVAEALGPYRFVVGTTSTRSRQLEVTLVAPRELPARLRENPPDTSTALVFGPEASGLNNDELSHCGLLVTVPCASRQPTLNLAQAVLVLAYELYLARQAPTDTSPATELPAATDEIEGLFDQLTPLLEGVGFARDDTFEGVMRDLRHLAARSGPTSREVQILRGICRRAQRALEHRE